MAVIRIGGFLHPALARTALAFAGATSALADKFQPAASRTGAAYHEAARLVAALLTPSAVVAGAFAMWRLGADLGWTGAFVVSEGLFSHWQVWVLLALGLKMTGSLITRGEEQPQTESEALSSRRTGSN